MYQTAIPMMMTRRTIPAMILFVVMAVEIRDTIAKRSIEIFIGQV